VTNVASPPARPDPGGTGPRLDREAALAGIAPEDTEVVPAAFAGMVTSARTAYRAMRVNSCYPALTAVAAVEDTVATLARISADLEFYVGDCSNPGAKAVVRAGELLCQARAALSDARHHLTLDDTDQASLMLGAVAPVG